MMTTAIRINGLTDAAKKLGVSKAHLSQVLHGKRVSKRLRQRARDLGIRWPRVPAMA